MPWLGGFFLVMFAANGALIYFALHTLHGEELENSYDASQAFNKRIAEARAQDERGWKADVLTRAEGAGERVMVEFHDRNGGADPRPRRHRPIPASVRRGAGPQRPARLRRRQLRRGREPPSRHGRWTLIIEASRGAERMFRSENKVTVTDTASD